MTQAPIPMPIDIAHLAKHLTIFIYILLGLLILYRPPQFKGLGQFIERHFGDSIGFYILHLGIILVLIGGVYPQVAKVSETGSALILAGMTALKLRSTPNGNGSGNSSSSYSATTNYSSTTPPKQGA